MEAGVIIGKFNKINTPCDIWITKDLEDKQNINQKKHLQQTGM